MFEGIDEPITECYLDQLLEGVIRPARIAKIASGHNDFVRTDRPISLNLDPERLRSLGGVKPGLVPRSCRCAAITGRQLGRPQEDVTPLVDCGEEPDLPQVIS